MDRALLGACGPPFPGVHHRSPGGRSNRQAHEGPGCYPSVTPGPRVGRPSTRSSGIPASVGIPPVVVGVRTRWSDCAGASAPTCTLHLDSGRKLRSRQARSRLTWSGVKAFGKGPGPWRECPRGRARTVSLACQGRVGRRTTMVVLDPAVRRKSQGTDRMGRPSGRSSREPFSGSFHRNPNPMSVTG